MFDPGSPDLIRDEQRVLEELEQFQLAIRFTRAQRRAATPAAYLHASGTPAEPPALAALPPALGPARVDVALPAPPSADGSGAGASWAAESGPHPAAAVFADAAPASLGLTWRLPAAIAALAAIIAVAAIQVINRPAPPAPVAPQIAPPLVVAVPPPAADPHPLRVDLTTVRRVWLRVTVDGRIAIEREVAAGEQLPFGADRSIVVRAGDAGGLKVRVGGVDQGPFGKDGRVLTRAFAAPGR